MSTRGSGIRNLTPPKEYPDAVLSQANPVSDTVYPVLATTRNVEVISAYVAITWAVTQPTNLRIIATVDGKTISWIAATPVSANSYYPEIQVSAADTAQILERFAGFVIADSWFLAAALKNMSGRSVKIDVAVTWAITQPTPLVCRVKHARW